MAMITRPMLAAAFDPAKLVFPVLASPKVDGIRCLCYPGLGPVSRSFKPIRNDHIRNLLDSNVNLRYLDGELQAGNFQETDSAVMTVTGSPSFTYHVFDMFAYSQTPFEERLKWAKESVERATAEFASKGLANLVVVNALEHVQISSHIELDSYEASCLERGYEGVMLRDPKGPYKSGRSTVREGWLLKVKRFVDSEACITGFEPLLRNQNEAQQDALGLQKRSSHKSGKIADELLGKIIVQDIHHGWKFAIGSGFNMEQRKEIWDNREVFLRTIVKYKYQPHGMKDVPRAPIFLGFRHPEDMS